MNWSIASMESKREDSPDTRCSIRPDHIMAAPARAARNCTTNARLAGSEGSFDGIVSRLPGCAGSGRRTIGSDSVRTVKSRPEWSICDGFLLPQVDRKLVRCAASIEA